jgi:hypothetical protein
LVLRPSRYWRKWIKTTIFGHIPLQQSPVGFSSVRCAIFVAGWPREIQPSKTLGGRTFHPWPRLFKQTSWLRFPEYLASVVFLG